MRTDPVMRVFWLLLAGGLFLGDRVAERHPVAAAIWAVALTGSGAAGVWRKIARARRESGEISESHRPRRVEDYCLAGFWFLSLGVAALPRPVGVHQLAVDLLIAAAACTMVWAIRRHPWLFLGAAAFTVLTNTLAASWRRRR